MQQLLEYKLLKHSLIRHKKSLFRQILKNGIKVTVKKILVSDQYLIK